MNLRQWLEAEYGRATKIAAHFAVSDAAISSWKFNGVPVDRMKAVRDYTEGAVTLDEMVPDSQPRPTSEPTTAAAGA